MPAHMLTLVCIQDEASDAKTELSAKGSPFEDDEVAEDGEGETPLAPVSFRRNLMPSNIRSNIRSNISSSTPLYIPSNLAEKTQCPDTVFIVVVGVLSSVFVHHSSLRSSLSPSGCYACRHAWHIGAEGQTA